MVVDKNKNIVTATKRWLAAASKQTIVCAVAAGESISLT